MSHSNNAGACAGCESLFDKYEVFEPSLRLWFDTLRDTHPDAHISCAGRGHVDQEAAFARGASKARYGQSAHNYNAAIDLWQMVNGVYTLSQAWFDAVVAPALTSDLKWYGERGAVFYELPHVEIANWRERVAAGTLKLVE
jgi:hypothetical protein